MELPPDYRDLICAFNDAECEYLIVGGYAMGAHGQPRYTGDIDLFFRRTAENAEKIIIAVRKFGYSSPDLTAESLIEPGMVHYFGRPPLRVDLLNTLSGIDFEKAWTNRVFVDHEGLRLPILSKNDLIANKRASGRLKDLADLEVLESESSEPRE
jgi:hypothetical protein